MNYLAHLFLSGENEKIIVGNFIADHVKGRAIDNYDSEIREGIRMHRTIDEFTDTHPIVRESVSRLRPVYSKYAGVIVDMYYDHFLAANWHRYSDEDLGEYTNSRFTILFRYYSILPPRAQRILPPMANHNWLEGYSRLDGLQQALAGMSSRTRFISNMEHAVSDLRDSYSNYRQEFFDFFPELWTYVGNEYGYLIRNKL
jgi:acyl carrier protein phosphodiesterase